MKLFKSAPLERRSSGLRKTVFFAGAFGLVLFLADQITKFLVEKNFSYMESREIIPGFFSLTYVTNKGAAWSILSGYGDLLLIFGAVTLVCAIVFIHKLTDCFTERYWAVIIAIAGIAGNSVDRLWRGEVVDFLDFYLKNSHYPVFNLADCYIFIGVALYILSCFLRPEEKKDKEKA